MLEVRGQVTQHTPDFFKSDEGTEVYAELERFGRDLDALRERLQVRFGDEHPVVAAFCEAGEALLDVYRAAGLVRLEDPPDGSPAAAHAVRQFYDRTRRRLTTQRERFHRAREDFIEAAEAVAGARLPSS
jgi:hypothetical protein